MIKYTSPLDWPMGKRRTRFPKLGGFQVSEAKAFASLEEQLQKLGCDEAIITTDLKLSKQTGRPLAGQAKTGKDLGVCVRITRRRRHYAIACDQFNEIWKNARCIALNIERLRAIERDDADFMEQALGGFAALPERAGEGNGWWAVLGVEPGADHKTVRAVYLALCKLHHPDQGGSVEAMARINAAWDAYQKGGSHA